MRMNFTWQPRIPNFHWKQQKGKITLPQTSQRKNVAGQKDLGCKRKAWVEIKKSVWRANIESPLSLLVSSLIWATDACCTRTRERAPKPRGAEGPFSPLPPALESPLAYLLTRLLFTISPKSRACSQGSLHSVMKQLNYQSALIGATNGNQPHSARSAHWPKYNFISNLLEQGCGRKRYLTRQRKNAGMSRVQLNSEKYSIWLSRASRKTIPLRT